MARCPDCGTEIPAEEKLRIGSFVECPECETALEVVCKNPFEVDYYLGNAEWEENDL